VSDARRVGARHFAPYEFISADTYLNDAYEARAEGDRKGTKDYAGLSKHFAGLAMTEGAGMLAVTDMGMPKDRDSALAELEWVKTRFRELDPCKAKVVAPQTYAHAETNLAQAEHEINEGFHYPEGIHHLWQVEPSVEAIFASDIDKDGVKDLEDGEPWIAEDLDGFQDEDGMPEPKPYPVLEPALFATASHQLSADAMGYLRGVGDMLLDGYKEATLHVTGHTDSDASDEYNLALSLRRADAVANYLREQGVQQKMVVTAHQGESQPIADNASASGKRQNRRVELMLDSPDPVSPFCQ